MSSGYALNELDRRLANMIRQGTISEVDTATKMAKVDIGSESEPVITEWLHWLVTRAGSKTKTWWAPEVGEQVVVLSPGGELGQGFILGAIFQSGTAGFEANGDEADVQRLTLDATTTLEVIVGNYSLKLSNTEAILGHEGNTVLRITDGQAKLGNNPTQHASIGEVTLVQLNKITTYLTALSAVWASPIPEAGMGAPSSLGTALNIAHTAAGNVPTMSDPSATEVFIK